MKLKSWRDELQHSDEYPKEIVHDLNRVVLNRNSGLVNKVFGTCLCSFSLFMKSRHEKPTSCTEDWF